MTKKRILFHASWVLSCFLIGFAILTEACGADDDTPYDDPPELFSCYCNYYVNNQSDGNCYISSKFQERMDFLALIPPWSTAPLHKNYEVTGSSGQCFNGKTNLEIYIWDQTGKLLIHATRPVLGEVLYFAWDGTTLAGGNPK